MYWKDKAVLIQVRKTVDADGYKTIAAERREVYVNKKSASRSEFYTAKQAGEKIALVLEVRGADYREEAFAEYGGRLYEVVRDYSRSGEIYELNCKEAPEPPDREGI